MKQHVPHKPKQTPTKISLDNFDKYRVAVSLPNNIGSEVIKYKISV